MLRKYGLSVFDVYIFDSFKEGYKFAEIMKLWKDTIHYLYAWENMFLMFPAVKLVFEDRGAAVFDKRLDNQLFVMMGHEADKLKYGDFAVIGGNGYTMSGARRISTNERVLVGFDLLGLWLSQVRTRSFGKKSASEVVKEVVGEVLEEYKKHSGIGYEIKTEKSVDVGSYVQANVSDTQFLYYLASVAKRSGGEKGFISWFERKYEGGKKKVVYRFESVESLLKKKISKKFKYEYDLAAVEKAFDNDGFIEDGVLPIISFTTDNRNTGLLLNRKVVELLEFDLAKRRVKKYDKKLVEDSEKDVIKSFLEKVGYKYKVKAVANKGMSTFERYIGYIKNLNLKRRLWVLTLGSSQLELGEKVRVILPAGYNLELIEALSGDWIVGSKVHALSLPDGHWLMKVGLFQVDWNKKAG